MSVQDSTNTERQNLKFTCLNIDTYLAVLTEQNNYLTLQTSSHPTLLTNIDISH